MKERLKCVVLCGIGSGWCGWVRGVGEWMYCHDFSERTRAKKCKWPPSRRVKSVG